MLVGSKGVCQHCQGWYAPVYGESESLFLAYDGREHSTGPRSQTRRRVEATEPTSRPATSHWAVCSSHFYTSTIYRNIWYTVPQYQGHIRRYQKWVSNMVMPLQWKPSSYKSDHQKRILASEFYISSIVPIHYCSVLSKHSTNTFSTSNIFMYLIVVMYSN